MTSIILSDRAGCRLRELLDDVDSPGEPADPGRARYGLRVTVESYGWAHRYRLSLAPEPTADELVVRLGDLDVFIDGRAADLVDGVRIDYVETPTSAGFTFHHPRPPRPDRPPYRQARAARQGRPEGAARQGRPEGADGDLRQRVEAALDEVRPYLWRDGGDATVVAVDGDTVRLALNGACGGCSAAQATVVDVIERQLTTALPEITHVVLVP